MQWRPPIRPVRIAAVLLAALSEAHAQAPAQARPPAAVTAWTVTLPGTPVAAPAVDAEAAYLLLDGPRLAAIALRDGAAMWSVAIGDVVAPPATADGLVLLAHHEEIEARAARDGSVRWRVPTDGTAAAPLHSQGGWLLVVTEAGRAIMLRAATGETLWTRSLGASTRIQPVVAGRQVYLALRDGRVAALALETGKPLWEARLPAEGTTLHPLGDRLFVGASNRFFYCLSSDRGKMKWRWRTGASIVGATAVDADRVYFVSLDNVLRALNRTGGDQRWKSALPHRPTGGPFLIGQVLFVPGVSSELPTFRAGDGKPAGSVKLAGEVPGTVVLLPGGADRAARLLVISGEGVAQLLEPAR